MERNKLPIKQCSGSMHSHQSVWVAHWMGVSCNAAAGVPNDFVNNGINIRHINHHEINRMEIESNTSRLVNHFGEIENRSFQTMYECVRTRNLRNESGQAALALWDGKATDKFLVSTSGKVQRHTQTESLLRQNKKKIKPHPFFQNCASAAVSKPLQDDFSQSESDIALLRYGHSDNNFQSSKNEIHFRQCNKSFSLNDPFVSNNHPPELGRERAKLHNVAGARRVPCCCSSPELTKSGDLHHLYHSLTRLPRSVHDGRTMRICASIDSVVGLSEDHQRFSQATRSFLITKKTDVNFSKGKENIEDFGLSAEFGGNSYHDPHRLSPFSSCGRGVKIHSLGSSTDSEGKGNSDDVKASKIFLENDSSAETEIMDMDPFMDLSDAGVRLLRSSKATKMDSRSSQLPSFSGVEIQRKHINTELPDVNLELCALSTGGNAKDGQELGSSETQSLDMDSLLGHADQTYKSISAPCSDDSLKSDPSARLPKRLKLMCSGSPEHGVHSSNFKELQHKKVNKLPKFTSEPAGDSSHGKEFVGSDKTATTERKCKASLVDRARCDRNLLLSQSWIRRWLHNEAGRVQKKTEARVVCEPQTSKLPFEDFQKKQFPSVAAMALVGKTISGFQPCELQRRASYAVWNT